MTSLTQAVRIEPAGAEALIVYFESNSLASNAASAQTLQKSIDTIDPPWLIESVLSYASLLISYDICLCSIGELSTLLTKLIDTKKPDKAPAANVIVLPICYELGTDLNEVAHTTKLSVEQVVQRHQSARYCVYAIGFAPGFAYLGGLDPTLTLPRRSTVRAAVPAGSLAIAEQQTAIYPSVSPGGWHLIGRCPTRLFNPTQAPHMPFAIGDHIQFKAINRKQYQELGGQE